MKKNITINLFGTLYNIDEDAYQLLDNYLQSMKRFFSSKDSGEEIADDIEHRVAELLWEKREQGVEAITIEIIKEIIGKIGNAEEIAGDDCVEAPECNDRQDANQQTDDYDMLYRPSVWQRIKAHFKNRRLYRDADNQLLGGVCSGLSHYFGFGDPVLWRLILLVLFLVEGVGLLAYLVLWLIVPLASTPEDKLRMKGITLTPENINQQIFNDHQSNGTSGGNGQSMASGCLKLLFGMLLLGPLVLLLFFLFVFGVAALGFVGGIGGILLDNSDFAFINSIYNLWGMPIGIVLFCIIMIIGILIFFLARLIFGKGKKMNKVLLSVLLIIILCCVAGLAYFIPNISMGVVELEERMRKNMHNMHNTDLTFDAQPHLDIPYLKQTGFVIQTNNTTRCTWSGDYPTGDVGRRYLDACNDDQLAFTAQRIDTVAPGRYTLTALVRAEDTGAWLFVETMGADGSNSESFQIIPALGNNGGNLWQWACGKASLPEVKKYYPTFSTDSVRQQIALANDGKGFGWTLAVIKGIAVKNGETIRYGITTDEDITNSPSLCDWVSATDFVLTKE